jgi:hypothetical protein
MKFHPGKNIAGIDASIQQILEAFGFADQFTQHRTGKSPSKMLAGAIAVMIRPWRLTVTTPLGISFDLIVETAMFVVRTEAEKNDGDGDQRNGDGELGQVFYSAAGIIWIQYQSMRKCRTGA